MAIGGALFGSPQYFLYNEIAIPKDFQQGDDHKKEDFSIRISPMFFKPKMHSYSRGVLIYDLYNVSNHRNKQFEGRKIVGGISLNKMYASKLGESVSARWIVGSGVYLNIANGNGLGAWRAYSQTTLSAEFRARIASQLLINNHHMLELSLQLPIFGVGLFGYSPTEGENVLFMIRFLYGD